MSQPRRDLASKQSEADDDALYVVCMPGAQKTVVPGSTQRNCLHCAEPIWVSPATLQSVAGKLARFICLNCAARQDELAKTLLPPSPQQLEELRRYLSSLEGGESP